MFSKTEIRGMRQTQDAHMMDTCMIYRQTGKVKDSRGQYVAQFDEGTESICGLQMDPAAGKNSDSYKLAEIDAIIRLPMAVIVLPGDEIEVIKRLGESVSPLRFEVDRFANQGITGTRAYCKAKAVK